jgi:predicted transcriptional regulator
MRITYLSLTAALVFTSAGAFAQTTPASTAPTPTAAPTTTTAPVTGKTISDRKENQQDRIAQGVNSGQLTPAEAARLETQEAGINKEESGMREADNGKLTAQDKATLNSQLNVESKDIYADKHNDATQPPAKGEIGDRLENQQDRIAAGIKDDKLTDSQAAHLETQEAGIDKEDAGMRAQDDGKLTAADKKLLNKQLNEESRRIRRAERRTTHPKK